jgi:UDP-N-acetylmuramoyl-L-alanyl-D-glutamate--2,6-diaminopimelate ligase
VNVDAAYSGEFLSKDIVVDTMYTYGVGPSAQVRAENIVHAVDTTEFDIRMPSSTFHLSTSLRGTFNVYNILAAVCILISQKVEIPQIVDIVKTITPVPGRLESIPNLRGYQIYVDYAHTEDSLKNVLETIHQIQGI